MSWERICQEIEDHPRLSPDQERALWQAYQDGDDRARQKLIACSLRYALGHAKRYGRAGQRWEPGDLLGEACQALAGCVERWDGSGSFSGYASARVRGKIQDFLRRKADVLRQPGGAERALSLDAPGLEGDPAFADSAPEDPSELRPMPSLSPRAAQVLALTVLRQPRPGTPEEAARELGLTVATVDRILRAALKAPRQDMHAAG